MDETIRFHRMMQRQESLAERNDRIIRDMRVLVEQSVESCPIPDGVLAADGG